MIERLTSLPIEELPGKTIRGVLTSRDDDGLLFAFEDNTCLFLRARPNYSEGARFEIEDPSASYLLDEMDGDELAGLGVFSPEDAASYHKRRKEQQELRSKAARQRQWEERNKEFGSQQTGMP